ncbi:hypothetical protein [Telmatospirillum sp. J64-1]|uniref:hypothetical protein n=1 Tax=Telmatospirillum sp. J64-1 TaxID=2502183 RepID=UPI001C8F4B77|nr:hypothetical protein [Telmatospirillum sp. J64-1]
MRRRLFAAAASAVLLGTATNASANDYATIIQPAKPGMPLAHPIADRDIPPPPFSLVSERPVRPAYVPGLPGLPQGRPVTDDFGRSPLKFDGVFIRQSRVENGTVVIPAGGLAYLEDTWGGQVALRGEPIPVLGRMPTYVDYDMSIVVQEDVTLPAGGSVAVGGQVYQYYATVGHNNTMNHTLHVKTVAGTDWEWAFGSPVLSTTQPGWWGGERFAQLYNQGQAREVSRQQIVFDWLSGVRMDRLVLAEEQLFAGLAGVGDSWRAGDRTIRIAAVDPQAGIVDIEIVEDGSVVHARTLGPVQPDLLIEDTAARKAIVFEYEDIIGFLSPWPEAFEGGKANLKIYGQAFSLGYGEDYRWDERFAVYPIGCPTGHNFGFMLVNKEEIRLRPGESVEGPEGYFTVSVDEISGEAVTAWYISDREGNSSVNLGGPSITNVDLVLGQGRVAGQAILKDVGRAMLDRTYSNMTVQAGHEVAAVMTATSSAPSQPSYGLMAAFGVFAMGLGAVGYEAGRRRGKSN